MIVFALLSVCNIDVDDVRILYHVRIYEAPCGKTFLP